MRKTKKVSSQRIFHTETESEPVAEFMTRIIKDISQFSSTFLLMSILIKAPNGLVLVKNDKDSAQRYHWGISQVIQEEKKSDVV
ncbi:hypothetical protein A3C73_00270 [Candidatus Giovannonibacteria bacterium RIFCSPHIGHO2_02_FULL_44_11]|nr:MAG: hypothetical protein A3C73_00270 [Candidatus Giovannonibacteria bacterium RIFCSPHIGHO2_02_FULL_44_11]